MEFPGLLKKENIEIPEVNKKRSRISRGVQGKTRGISGAIALSYPPPFFIDD